MLHLVDVNVKAFKNNWFLLETSTSLMTFETDWAQMSSDIQTNKLLDWALHCGSKIESFDMIYKVCYIYHQHKGSNIWFYLVIRQSTIKIDLVSVNISWHKFYQSDFSHVPSVAIADVIVVWKTLTWERKDLFWWHEEDVL